MTIRKLAIPLLSSGALLLGYVAFSRRHRLHSAPESRGPRTQREVELPASGAHEKLPAAHAALLHDSPRPEPVGARFLGRLSDALSPFGAERERELR